MLPDVVAHARRGPQHDACSFRHARPPVQAAHLSRAHTPAQGPAALLLPALISLHTICHFIELGMRSASMHCEVAAQVDGR